MNSDAEGGFGSAPPTRSPETNDVLAAKRRLTLHLNSLDPPLTPLGERFVRAALFRTLDAGVLSNTATLDQLRAIAREDSRSRYTASAVIRDLATRGIVHFKPGRGRRASTIAFSAAHDSGMPQQLTLEGLLEAYGLNPDGTLKPGRLSTLAAPTRSLQAVTTPNNDEISPPLLLRDAGMDLEAWCLEVQGAAELLVTGSRTTAHIVLAVAREMRRRMGDDGYCYPGSGSVALALGVARQTVESALTILVGGGFLVRRGYRKRRAVFVAALPTCEHGRVVANDMSGARHMSSPMTCDAATCHHQRQVPGGTPRVYKNQNPSTGDQLVLPPQFGVVGGGMPDGDNFSAAFHWLIAALPKSHAAEMLASPRATELDAGLSAAVTVSGGQLSRREIVEVMTAGLPSLTRDIAKLLIDAQPRLPRLKARAEGLARVAAVEKRQRLEQAVGLGRTRGLDGSTREELLDELSDHDPDFVAAAVRAWMAAAAQEPGPPSEDGAVETLSNDPSVTDEEMRDLRKRAELAIHGRVSADRLSEPPAPAVWAWMKSQRARPQPRQAESA